MFKYPEGKTALSLNPRVIPYLSNKVPLLLKLVWGFLFEIKRTLRNLKMIKVANIPIIG